MKNSKKIIDANTQNPTTFTRGDSFVTLSLQLNSMLNIVENIHYITNLFFSDLLAMSINKLSEPFKTKISQLECTKNNALITTVNINNCQSNKNTFSCTATIKSGRDKVELFKMMPYNFNGCKIGKVFNIDESLKPYSICTGPNCFSIKIAEDPCLKGIRDLNITTITKSCPLETTQTEYEFMYHGLVFNYLTNDTKSKLEKAGIPIINLPFSIEGGAKNISLDAQIEFAFNGNFKLYNPVLPFKSSLLCPRKSSVKLNVLQEATTNVPLLILAALTNLFLVLFVYLFYKILTCCCCSCSRNITPRRQTRVLRQTEDLLLNQLNRRR